MAVVRDIDRGYKSLIRRVASPLPPITVGVHGDEGGASAGGDLTVVDVASIHEFGLNGTERSFIRAWFDSEKSTNEDVLKLIGRAMVRKGGRPRAAAERAALFLEASAKRYIQSGSVSPATDKDGTTLIESSQLVGSIRGKVGK